MAQIFKHTVFPFAAPPELLEGRVGTVPVCVIGAGPVGLATAIDLAIRGVRVVLVDDDETVSHGSRLICISKRTLEIFDRLGAGAGFAEKGVVWNKGRLFFGEDEVYSFDLLKEEGHQWPAFVNIQQYYAEDFLVHAAERLPNLDIRWKSAVVAVGPASEYVRLSVETPEGRYDLDADYVVACDGASSFVRRELGLEFQGRAFQDRFLTQHRLEQDCILMWDNPTVLHSATPIAAATGPDDTRIIHRVSLRGMPGIFPNPINDGWVYRSPEVYGADIHQNPSAGV